MREPPGGKTRHVYRLHPRNCQVISRKTAGLNCQKSHETIAGHASSTTNLGIGLLWQGSGLRSGCWRRRRLFCRGGWWCSSSRPSGRGQGGGRGWLCPRIWFVVRCLCDRCFGQFRAWKMGSGGRRGVRHGVAGLCRTFLQTGLWQVFRRSRRWGLFLGLTRRLHAGLICVAPPFESAAGGASG